MLGDYERPLTQHERDNDALLDQYAGLQEVLQAATDELEVVIDLGLNQDDVDMM